jgi:hypothetical protein
LCYFPDISGISRSFASLIHLSVMVTLQSSWSGEDLSGVISPCLGNPILGSKLQGSKNEFPVSYFHSEIGWVRTQEIFLFRKRCAQYPDGEGTVPSHKLLMVRGQTRKNTDKSVCYWVSMEEVFSALLEL